MSLPKNTKYFYNTLMVLFSLFAFFMLTTCLYIECNKLCTKSNFKIAMKKK